MKQITKVRKSVCAMANQLRKAGYSLKDAFKKAWQRVKLSMTVRAAGVSFENRQERLAFWQQFKPEDLTVTLEREKENKFDCNAIQIVVHIKPIRRRTVIGYVPAKLARELSKVLDMGIQVKAILMQIIGGYGWKESRGNLIDGYTSYLLARAHGIQCVPIRYGRRQIVYNIYVNNYRLEDSAEMTAARDKAEKYFEEKCCHK